MLAVSSQCSANLYPVAQGAYPPPRGLTDGAQKCCLVAVEIAVAETHLGDTSDVPDPLSGEL